MAPVRASLVSDVFASLKYFGTSQSRHLPPSYPPQVGSVIFLSIKGHDFAS